VPPAIRGGVKDWKSPLSPTRRELVKTTRNRILAAAARLLRERGANGFSMDVLAKEAGVARATVYEHFRSKRALLDELASTTTRSLVLDNDSGQTDDPLTALRDMLGAVCRHWSAHDDTIRDLRTLVAATGATASLDGLDESYLRCLVEAIAASGQLRARWSVDDAVDALAVLTSHATFERLRRSGARTPAQVETLLARLAVVIVSPTATSATATNAASAAVSASAINAG
jgi:AcrR family transcriptional regulator